MQNLPVSTLTKSQTKTFTVENKGGYKLIVVKVRFDDECGNGHNTFAITGSAYRTQTQIDRDDPETCGSIHDIISKHFPELKPLIKWHLVSTDGPMAYLANTLYHASDRDYNGLRKGETRQIRKPDGTPCWILECDAARHFDGDTPPEVTAKYVPWVRVGEGKEPNLEAARSSAVWPDATLEQLQDKQQLLERLPALMDEFKKDVESLGFTY